MSATYDLICHECRVGIWIGQSAPSHMQRFRLYTPVDDLHTLEAFLNSHLGHHLECNEDQTFNLPFDYETLELIDEEWVVD